MNLSFISRRSAAREAEGGKRAPRRQRGVRRSATGRDQPHELHHSFYRDRSGNLHLLI